MATCRACGRNILWVEVDGERVAVDSLPQMAPPGGDGPARYALDPLNNERAWKLDRPNLLGYANHHETCPSR
jgi:hypothetical protein